MTERWLPIAGHPHYDVSDLGNVRSWRKQARGGLRDEPKLRKLVPDKDGYHRVNLETAERKQISHYVHNLVLTAFKEPRPPGLECRHLDGSATNNVPSNLEWGTALQNSADKRKHGTMAAVEGENNKNAKLNVEKVRAIRSAADRPTRELAEELGVGFNAVWNVRKGKTWKWVA